MKRLQDRGLPVELRLVERVPNREALEIYRGADVVFDQCLIGYHGYFALEAMAMGKPVVVFLRDPVLAPDECPLVNVRPETVEAVFESLVTDRHRLHELGRQGRRYIEEHYSVEAFARRLGRAYAELGRNGQGGRIGVATVYRAGNRRHGYGLRHRRGRGSSGGTWSGDLAAHGHARDRHVRPGVGAAAVTGVEWVPSDLAADDASRLAGRIRRR